MTKNFAYILIALSMVSIAIAADATCKNHPAFVKAKILIQDAIKGDEKGKVKGEKLFKSFENAKTSVRTASDLGVCKDYAGQKTCCDTNIVQLIDQAALLKTKPIQQTKNAFHKIVVVYNNLLNKKCQKENVVPTSVDQIFSNTKLTNFQKLRETQKQCKINFGKSISALTRGAMCSICAGVEKVNDYFQNNQLKISPESLASFQQATNDAVTCISGVFSTTNLDNILLDLNTNYIKNNDSCINDINTKIKSVFSDPKVNNDDGKGGKKCKGTSIFTSNSNCENALQGASDLEDKGNARFLEIDGELNRLLQETEDAVSAAGGVNIYLTSSTDNVIDEFGNINGNFDNIKASSFKIAFSALAVAFFVLFM